MSGTGRRPGRSGTRSAILAAAREQFARAGYRGATIRAIAAEAGVDPALVHHYFGTKRQLFTAALDLPVDPEAVAATLVGADPATVGALTVRTFLGVWRQPAARARLRILLATVATDEQAAGMMREFLVDTILGPLGRSLDADRPELRATLAASQMIGFALAAYVVGLEPLASASDDEVVEALAPTIQRYLTGDLGGAGG